MNGTRAAVVRPIAGMISDVPAVDRSRTWRRTTFAAAACITVLDAALLERKHGLFTGGFLASHQFGTTADSVAFLVLSALLNASLAAPLTVTALFLGRWLRLRPLPVRLVAFCAAVMPLAIADFVIYQVWSYLGDAFDFHVMFALTGHRLSEAFAIAAPLLSRPLFIFALGLCAMAGATALLQRLDRRPAESIVLPTVRTILQRCAGLVAMSAVTVTALSMSDAVGFGLRWTASGQLFTVVVNRLSDVDRDGYGPLRNPRDNAAFDPAIHPYAVDVPGNGIDEDGIAGDLPVASVVPETPPLGPAEWPQRPPVILFVLESVRAEAVGTSYGGRRVTPVMDAVAAQGLKVESAWAHAGSTVQSRYHILSGTLIPDRGNSTLLDDFKNHGYDVAYFSGQDDDFGSMGLHYQRVDKFYDARQDVARRYSTSTTPGSLAVPLGVVEERIREYIGARRSNNPLFLYVNFHDTHYPYNHAGLENILGVELLPPSLISPARRPELTRTYLNATANVDRAIGRVIEEVASHIGQRPGVMVISDHGESLFEQGFLGHGFALNDAQTRVPLIVSGLPVKITMPFGLADIRRTLNEALASGRALETPPVAKRSAGARVFQYLGTLETPGQIGWTTEYGSFTYDFRSDRIGLWESAVRPRDLTGEPRRTFQELIYGWESMLLVRNARPSDAQ
jgi:hypothetical protein